MNLGVIIGRFQIDDLHEGHKKLIDRVVSENDHVLVLVGKSIVDQPTRKYPLPYNAIVSMVREYNSKLIIYPIEDSPKSNLEWSEHVDSIITQNIYEKSNVTIYGGRDSFIPYYKGVFDCKELKDIDVDASGTMIRNKISKGFLSTKEERRGAIWSVNKKYPICYPTVDIGIFNYDKTKILLGRKKGEEGWRLPGGFVDPGETLEHAAMRETFEETNVIISHPKYCGSFVINDKRYVGEQDNITTSLFWGIAQSYHLDNCYAKAGDDLEEVKWFELDYHKYMLDVVIESHKNLIGKLMENL